MTHRYRWLIFLLSGVLIGGYLVYAALIRPVIEIVNRTPQPLTTYSSRTVEAVCDLLSLNSNDSFCREPSQQNAVSLEEMLERNFPLGETSFDDIMPLLANLPSRTNGAAIEGADFEPNGCQTFLEEDYECYVVFPGDIHTVTIRFTRNRGRVIDYGVTVPGT